MKKLSTGAIIAIVLMLLSVTALAIGLTVEEIWQQSYEKMNTSSDEIRNYGEPTADEISLDKAPGMLPGMTADVDVKIQGTENALIIPVEALHQTSTGAFVYTTYDEETQQYGGKVDVVAGMQNDNYAEILSGLQEGDTVYYTEQENIFAYFASMMGMPGGMPSGMPSGMPGGR